MEPVEPEPWKLSTGHNLLTQVLATWQGIPTFPRGFAVPTSGFGKITKPGPRVPHPTATCQGISTFNEIDQTSHPTGASHELDPTPELTLIGGKVEWLHAATCTGTLATLGARAHMRRFF